MQKGEATLKLLGALLIAGVATGVHAQDITRVLPNGATFSIDRTAQGVTVSREGPHFSYSFSRGPDDTASAAATATASGPHIAYARASAVSSVKTNANGQSIGTAHAVGIAIGRTSSTSATSKP